MSVIATINEETDAFRREVGNGSSDQVAFFMLLKHLESELEQSNQSTSAYVSI